MQSNQVGEEEEKRRFVVLEVGSWNLELGTGARTVTKLVLNTVSKQFFGFREKFIFCCCCVRRSSLALHFLIDTKKV